MYVRVFLFVMMVAAAVSETASTVDSQNPNITCNPFFNSEKGNRNVTSNKQKNAKSRIVSSRYMSPSIRSTSAAKLSLDSSSLSSPGRSPSPLVSGNSTPSSNGNSLGPKRYASVEKRRPTAARTLTPDLEFKIGNATDVSAAKKLLVTSTRRLSVSFQGEGFSLPVSKTKVTPQPNLSSVRKETQERRRTGTPLGRKGDNGDQIDISMLVDQHRWPSGNPLVNRSLNCGIGEATCELTGSGDGIQALRQSVIDESRRSLDSRLNLDLDNSEILNAVQRAPDGNSVYKESSLPSDLITYDSDSVSSGSTSGVQESGGASQRQNGYGGIVDLAQFWQEMNNRLRRLQDPSSPLSTSTGSRIIAPSKLKKYTSGGIRAASPCKLMSPVSSPSWGHSPSRIRNAVSTICNNFVEAPSVLSFAVDIRRGKFGENQILDAHLLRLLYNRHLQWCFVNARTEAGLLVQKHNSEKNLWNAWITISDLRDTVTKKSHRLQLLKRKLKLAFILKGQTTSLEDWASMDKDHSFSLVGAIEALTASTLRLPATGGATADIQSLKDAIGSAVEVIHAVASSICLLQPMLQNVNSLATELAKVTVKERALLEQCTDFISLLADMQVKDSSLRTQLLQHNHVSYMM